MSRTPARTAEDRRVLPFGVHQAFEYLLGAVVVVTALHVPSGVPQYLLLAAGAALFALPLLSDGPLGGSKVLNRRAHRFADGLAVLALALLPLTPGRNLLVTAVLEALAFCVWRLSRLTRYEPAVAPGTGRGGALVGRVARQLGRQRGRHELNRSGSRRPR